VKERMSESFKREREDKRREERQHSRENTEIV